MGVGVYGGKDSWKNMFSLEWKSEGVMDDDSGDSEEDEGEEDLLRQGWRSETGSLYCTTLCLKKVLTFDSSLKWPIMCRVGR